MINLIQEASYNHYVRPAFIKWRQRNKRNSRGCWTGGVNVITAFVASQQFDQ